MVHIKNREIVSGKMGRPFVVHTTDESLDDTKTEDEVVSEEETEDDEVYDDLDSEGEWTDHTTNFRCKWLCDGATSLSEMAAMLRTAADHLVQMQAEGYKLDPSVSDGNAIIYEPGHFPFSERR